jgi:PAS domain S-box-containing protein
LKELIKLISLDQQQQLLSLLINGPDFVSLCSLSGSVNYLNSSGRNLVGLEKDERIHQPDSEFVMPFEFDRLLNTVNSTLVKEGSWIGKMVYRHFKTGEPIPVHVTSILIYDDESGLPISKATIARDLRQEELAFSREKKLMALVDNSKDLMSLLTLSGTNEYINEGGQRLLGIDKEEDITEIHISSFHTKEQLKFVEEELLPSVMQKGHWSGKFSARHYLTGEIIPLENNCIRIDDPYTGHPVAIGAVMRDLRPEIAAQNAIRQSEQRFRHLIADAPVAIALLEGASFVVAEANDKMLVLWGKSQRVIGSPILKAIPEIENQGFIELLEQVRRTGVTYYGNETLIKLKRNGKLEDSYFNFVYAKAAGEVDAIIVVATDVTSQVTARGELITSEQRFKSLVLDAPMATALYRGKELIIEIANPSMLSLWDKDDSVTGKPLKEAIPELEGQPFIGRLQEIMESGITYHADQEKAELLVKGEMQTFWFNYTYKPLFNQDGHVDRILNMAVDVSSLVKLQKLKDDFIALASHELKTPLTTIKGYAQILQVSEVINISPIEKKMLDRINQQIDKLTRLVGELLDVTHIHAGKIPFFNQLFDLGTLAEEIAGDLQFNYLTHSIVVQRVGTFPVWSDKDKIAQVIANLIGNAVKYSPGQTQAVINVFSAEQSATFSIRDFGIGIAEENRTRIFEQFYRVDEMPIKSFPGLGLGLYISSEIIRRAGGMIWMEPAEGAGSVFYFTLPLHPDSA